MRSGNKASLRNYLTKGIPNANLPTEIVQVIDGGALLYQVKWCLYTKFSDAYMSCERHLYSKFGFCYVVFDGYENDPSTKDMQYIKRNGKVSPNITFTSNTKYIKSQDKLLDNQNNKAHLIAGSSNYMSKNGFQVYQCVEDADATIVRVVLEYHSSGTHVVANADDTDVLCLLIHHWKKAASRLYFSIMKSNTDNCHNFEKELRIKLISIKNIF